MKIEKLNYGKEKNKRMFLYGFIVAVVLLILVNIIASKAMYRKTESVQLANGTINYTPYDFKIMAMYQEKENHATDDDKYEEINIMPGSEYVINESKSYCTLDNQNRDNKAILKTFEGKHIISHLTKQDKCYLYFDRETSAASKTVFSLGLKTEGAIDKITGPSCSDNSKCGAKNMNQNGLYYAGEDDDGPSYVFRGTVDNNWVKFGQTSDNKDIWWRIIRINGDGTIRLIYAGEGTSISGNGENIETTNTQYNKEEKIYKDNTGVGYYTGAIGGTDFTKTHSNSTPSTIAERTEKWFTETNLNEAEQLKHIDENAGFCNNRQISQTAKEWYSSEDATNRGTGTVVTAYKVWYNTFTTTGSWRSDVNYANLKCSSSAENFEENADYKRDYYTWKGKATRGNKALNYPVGQITVDEVIFAGGFGNQSNSGYWLNSGTYYWTMSPRHMSTTGYAVVFNVNNNGNFGTPNVYNTTPGVRPVINLKADTKFTFSNPGAANEGTTSNPYIVSD